jgi:hypothetical protein
MKSTNQGETKMTTLQRMALVAMAEDNCGAVLAAGKWCFPVHVRESEDVAIQVLSVLRPFRQVGPFENPSKAARRTGMVL